MEMALRKFALKHSQDDGVSGSSLGDIVLEKCSSNRFWLNIKEVTILLRSITIEIAHAERHGACISDVLPLVGKLFAHCKTCGEAAGLDTMTATVSIRLVDRLEWRARKYYDMPLLVLAHVIDPTQKGVGLKTSCDDPASWATIMELLTQSAYEIDEAAMNVKSCLKVYNGLRYRTVSLKLEG
jgi:hypothetical protein